MALNTSSAFAALCSACEQGQADLVRDLLHAWDPFADDGSNGARVAERVAGAGHAAPCETMARRGSWRVSADVCREAFQDACVGGSVCVVHEFLALCDERRLPCDVVRVGFLLAFKYGHVALMAKLCAHQHIGSDIGQELSIFDVMFVLSCGHVGAMAALLRIVKTPLRLPLGDMSFVFALRTQTEAETKAETKAETGAETGTETGAERGAKVHAKVHAGASWHVNAHDAEAWYFLQGCADGNLAHVRDILEWYNGASAPRGVIEAGFWCAFCSASMQSASCVATAWTPRRVSSCAWRAHLLLRACEGGNVEDVRMQLAHIAQGGHMVRTIVNMAFQTACYFDRLGVVCEMLGRGGMLRVCHPGSVACLRCSTEAIRDACRAAWAPWAPPGALDAVQAKVTGATSRVAVALDRVAAREAAWDRRRKMVTLRRRVRG